MLLMETMRKKMRTENKKKKKKKKKKSRDKSRKKMRKKKIAARNEPARDVTENMMLPNRKDAIGSLYTHLRSVGCRCLCICAGWAGDIRPSG